MPSAEALARDCAIPESTIAAIERGEPIADPVLHGRLAHILRIDIEDIAPDAA